MATVAASRVRLLQLLRAVEKAGEVAESATEALDAYYRHSDDGSSDGSDDEENDTENYAEDDVEDGPDGNGSEAQVDFREESEVIEEERVEEIEDEIHEEIEAEVEANVGEGIEDEVEVEVEEEDKDDTEEATMEESSIDEEADRLGAEVIRCKLAILEAQRYFIESFERAVKSDVLSPLTALHTVMCAKLPLEVRDMIYWYLATEDQIYTNAHGRRWNTPVHVGKNRCFPNFGTDPEMQIDDNIEDGEEALQAGTYDGLKPGGWLFNPEYMGNPMASEIAQVFYSVNDFAIGDHSHLLEFLTEDRTQAGVKPYEYIRGKIWVSVVTTRSNGSMERVWQNTENEFGFLNGIYTQLNALSLLTQKSPLDISIKLQTAQPNWRSDEEGERRFYNIMEAVRAPVFDLIHEGFQVSVAHFNHGNSSPMAISGLKGLRNYFTLSREHWNEERSTHTSNWLPSTNFISREEIKDEARKCRLRDLLRDRWNHTETIYDCSAPPISACT